MDPILARRGDSHPGVPTCPRRGIVGVGVDTVGGEARRGTAHGPATLCPAHASWDLDEKRPV